MAISQLWWGEETVAGNLLSLFPTSVVGSEMGWDLRNSEQPPKVGYMWLVRNGRRVFAKTDGKMR